jgi:uncharacterized protein
MRELAWVTALLAGLLGSGHCLAMCGGIAAALGSAGRQRPWHLLLYQLGRLTSYAIAGSIAGALGAAAGFAFAVSRWSELLRLATAVVVIAIGLDIALGANALTHALRAPERWGARLWRRMAPLAAAHQPAPAPMRALVLGVLWGWLPCGLVYSVLLAAAVSGGAARGGATMIVFGLGTLPAMSGLTYLGRRLPQRGGTLARLLGASLVACGLWTAVVPLALLTGSPLHAHQHGSEARVR